MSLLDRIYQAVLFIEDNLKTPLSVAAAADAAGYSLYYFTRVFNKITRHSPYDYIIRRRLSKAADEIIYTDNNIFNIALDYQFNNHETFTRAFSKMFAILPSLLRSKGNNCKLIYRSPLTYDYLLHLNKYPVETPEVVKSDSLYFLGLPIADLTETSFLPLQDNLQNSLIRAEIPYTNNFFTVLFHPTSWDYQQEGLLALQVESLEKTPGLLLGKRLLPNSYLIFTYQGNLEEIHHTLCYIYQTWLGKSNIQQKASTVLALLNLSDLNNKNQTNKTIKIMIPLKSNIKLTEI